MRQPQASAADITKFLSDSKATVVGGPTAGGLFKLHVSDKTLSDAELRTIESAFPRVAEASSSR